MHQVGVVFLLERLAQDFLGLFRSAQTQQLLRVGRHQQRFATQVERHMLPALGQRLQAALALPQPLLASLFQRGRPYTALEIAQLGVLQRPLLAQLRQQHAQRRPVA
ncbi:hypothetical protein D9M70_591940 [compost metagenome]